MATANGLDGLLHLLQDGGVVGKGGGEGEDQVIDGVDALVLQLFLRQRHQVSGDGAVELRHRHRLLHLRQGDVPLLQPGLHRVDQLLGVLLIPLLRRLPLLEHHDGGAVRRSHIGGGGHAQIGQLVFAGQQGQGVAGLLLEQGDVPEAVANITPQDGAMFCCLTHCGSPTQTELLRLVSCTVLSTGFIPSSVFIRA